jgi:hypothetical protein
MQACKQEQVEGSPERRRRKVAVAARPAFPECHTGNAVVHAAAAPFTAAIMDPKSTALLMLPITQLPIEIAGSSATETYQYQGYMLQKQPISWKKNTGSPS